MVKASCLGLKRSHRWIFRNLNLEIPRGQFIGLRGGSGVGKTSLFEILAGLSQPSEGTVNVSASPIGWIDQSCTLSSGLSVEENLLLGSLYQNRWWSTLLKLPTKSTASDLKGLLALMELDIRLETKAGLLSGGERQRISLARVLLQRPALILADEPISMLPPRLQRKMLGLLKRETDRGASILCSLHNPSLLEEFSDRVFSLSPFISENHA